MINERKENIHIYKTASNIGRENIQLIILKKSSLHQNKMIIYQQFHHHREPAPSTTIPQCPSAGQATPNPLYP